jgi:hypothetical protein
MRGPVSGGKVGRSVNAGGLTKGGPGEDLDQPIAVGTMIAAWMSWRASSVLARLAASGTFGRSGSGFGATCSTTLNPMYRVSVSWKYLFPRPPHRREPALRRKVREPGSVLIKHRIGGNENRVRAGCR